MIKPPKHQTSHHTLPLRIPRDLLDKLDTFGVAQGFKTRTATIIHLLQQALKGE